MKTIFEKIIDGDIQCHRVFENEHVLAFLDIAPLSLGHTLVIPKEPVAFLHELSEDCGAALGKALITVSSAVVQATGCTQYNVLQNNGGLAHQAVLHVHFHIIPRPDDGGGLEIGWNPSELQDGESLAQEIRDLIV